MERCVKITLLGVCVGLLIVVGVVVLRFFVILIMALSLRSTYTTMSDIEPTNHLTQLLKGRITDKSIDVGTLVAGELLAANLSVKISDVFGDYSGKKMKENALVSVVSLSGQTGTVEIGLFIKKDAALNANGIKRAIEFYSQLIVEELEMVDTATADVKYSKTILMASTRLSSSIDLSILPCTDFNKFVCNNWNDTNAIESVQYKVLLDLVKEMDKLKANDVVPRYYRQMKLAYDICTTRDPSNDQLDRRGRKAFFVEMFNRIGGFPAIQKSWKEPAKGINIGSVVGISFALAGPGSTLVRLETLPDNNNPDMVVPLLTLAPPPELRSSLVDRLSTLFNDDLSVDANDIKRATAIIVEMRRRIEIAADFIWEPYFHEPHPELFANRVDISTADKQVPGFDFRAFFDSLTTAETPGYNASSLSKYYIENPLALSSAVDYLKRQKARDIQNVLAYFVADTVAKFIPEKKQRGTRAELTMLHMLETGTVTPIIDPRWPVTDEETTFDLVHLNELAKKEPDTARKICLMKLLTTESPFKDAVGRLYVDQLLPREDFEFVRSTIPEIVSHVKDSLIQMLQAIDWLETASKAAAIKKIESISTTLVIGEWTLDDLKLNDYMRKVQLVAGDDIYINLFKTQKYFNLMASYCNIEQIGQKLDRNYGTASSTVNAWMNHLENSVNIPAAIMQPPFYYLSTDSPLLPINYGAIGAVIGHEFGHGFDTGGVFWNVLPPRLTNVSFLSDETTFQAIRYPSACNRRSLSNSQNDAQLCFQRFKRERVCMMEKYHIRLDYLPVVLGYQSLSVTRTHYSHLNQGYADMAGLQSSFRALQNTHESPAAVNGLAGPLYMFTPEQMFFVSWAHIWCSFERQGVANRTNNAFQNFPDGFAASFKCAPQSGMRPEKRCAVWSN